MFFSNFEELNLPATGPMDHHEATTKLYEQSPTPILNIGPCDLMLGKVPLFPLLLKGKGGAQGLRDIHLPGQLGRTGREPDA